MGSKLHVSQQYALAGKMAESVIGYINGIMSADRGKRLSSSTQHLLDLVQNTAPRFRPPVPEKPQ